VLLDYDGSLAAIVDDPARAMPLPAARAALGALANEVARVAVISGRTVEFLRRALNVSGIEYIGLYGMQRLVDGAVVVHHDAEPYVSRVADAVRRARRELPPELVEPKDALTVTLHFRTAPDRAEDVQTLAASLAGELGLRAVPGRLAVELRPPIDVDKGTATRDASRGMRSVLFAGDDHGDLAAFTALDELIALGEIDHAIRVAVHSDEAPPELLRRADITVGGPAELAVLLDDLAVAIRERRRRAR